MADDDDETSGRRLVEQSDDDADHDHHYADTRPPFQAPVGWPAEAAAAMDYPYKHNVTAQQALLASSGGHCAGAISSNKSVSYSKLFSQYLNNKPATGVGHAGRNSASAASKLIASALNRFKISASNPSGSGGGGGGGGGGGDGDDDDDAGTQVGPVPYSHSTTAPDKIGTRIKRKGFMYLKRSASSVAKPAPDKFTGDLNNNNSNNSSGGNYNTSNSSRNHSGSSNCSHASCHMLSASPVVDIFHSQRKYDEHKAFLLDEEPDESPAECQVEQEAAGEEASEARMKTHRRRQQREAPGRQRPEYLMVGSLSLVAVLYIGLLVVLDGSGRATVMGQQLQQAPQVLGGAPFIAAAGRSQAQPTRPQPAAGSLVANINCNKIRGHVTLAPLAQGGSTVSARIVSGPPGEVYQWSVHQFPVKPGAGACTCSPMVLGAKLIDLGELHGNLLGEQDFSVQSALSLMGPDSPVGHSLLLRGIKTGMLACATFLPTSRKSNYRAKFHSPISGSVSVFQTAFGTSFVSHLMYSNGSRRHSVHRFDLVHSEEDIITSAPLSGASAVVSSLAAGQLSNRQTNLEQMAWEQREHELEMSQCRRFQSGEPLLRNSSFQLAISTENFGMRGRTSLVLPLIPFETFSSVFVVVYSEHDPLEPIACAPLRFVKPKTAAAKFQSVSVQGSVVFSQDSPFDPTLARVNLNLPNSDGHSYGIDELPMIIRRKSDTRVCPNIREIIYNPHQVEPGSVPAEGEATSDQYAVGDLSGKYGSLVGKPSEKLQVQDFNLPLYGPASIIGRAMTIYSAEGLAIACSNIELTSPMTTAFATFDFGIQGQFIFRQPVNDCNGDTYVYIEVSKPTTSGASAAASSSGADPHLGRSIDHNWHIHNNPVDSGLDHLSSTDCHPAGHHFNPYNTSTSHIYARDCTPFNGLRCELGDLSAKMFPLEIPPYRTKGGHQEPDIGKFFGTDIDLPLCGPVSIVNRSVVVHGPDFGSHRLACSTVIEFKSRV